MSSLHDAHWRREIGRMRDSNWKLNEEDGAWESIQKWEADYYFKHNRWSHPAAPAEIINLWVAEIEYGMGLVSVFNSLYSEATGEWVRFGTDDHWLIMRKANTE